VSLASRAAATPKANRVSNVTSDGSPAQIPRGAADDADLSLQEQVGHDVDPFANDWPEILVGTVPCRLAPPTGPAGAPMDSADRTSQV
jgi:hypothetical protein